MSKAKEGGRIFGSGRELLENCVEKLNENQRGETGGNVALYPTVIILMGQKSSQYTQHIKNTLDDNWNNARFLQYLNVVKKQGVWKCYFLSQEQTKRGKCVWEQEEKDWPDALNCAIVKMLETDERIFSNRMKIKMEYVLNATENYGMDYVDLFLQTASSLYADELKTLYLMLDQRPENEYASASDKLLQYLVQKKNLPVTVYLLSNYLQSGQMLGSKNIWQNYRLAANIMLLGGNRGSKQEISTRLFGGIKTVSYALVTKPTDEIAEVSLQELLRELRESEYRKPLREMSGKDIRDQLQMDQYNGMKILDELYDRNFLHRFPEENDWQHLPFCSWQEYKQMRKSKDVALEAADAATCGAAREFLRKYYTEPVEQFFADEKKIQECRSKISGALSAQFTYCQLLYLQEHYDEVRDVLNTEYYFAGAASGDGFCKRLHDTGIYESRRIFYTKMKKIIEEELGKLTASAACFRELYAECEKEILQERVVTGDESQSIEEFYSEIVKGYVQAKQNGNGQVSAFPEVFRVTNSKETLLRSLWEAFLDLIRDKVFDCDFETEINNRMKGMEEAGRHKFVSGELSKKLSGSIRIKNVTQLSMSKAGSYYLVNASAVYAKTLADAQNREYMLFDLNRTDCIEQLEIYDITNPNRLHLVLEDVSTEDK